MSDEHKIRLRTGQFTRQEPPLTVDPVGVQLMDETSKAGSVTDPTEIIDRRLIDIGNAIIAACDGVKLSDSVSERAQDAERRLNAANFAIADLSTHVIVPREPTQAMIDACRIAFWCDPEDHEDGLDDAVRTAYRAMINHKDSALADEPKPKTWPARKPNWMA